MLTAADAGDQAIFVRAAKGEGGHIVVLPREIDMGTATRAASERFCALCFWRARIGKRREGAPQA
jgi:hypothetical protein